MFLTHIDVDYDEELGQFNYSLIYANATVKVVHTIAEVMHTLQVEELKTLKLYQGARRAEA